MISNMEAWKFVKEEPIENECYETEANDYYNSLNSYPTLGVNRLLDDVKIENRDEFYSAYESETLYNVNIKMEDEFYSELDSEQVVCRKEFESNGEFYPELNSEQKQDPRIINKEDFPKGEENNNQDSWKSGVSYYPELSVPLVRLEYSRNQEVVKYLKPLLPAITSLTQVQLTQQATELNMKLKMESVELETLTENTIVQSPNNYCYASPWDFVSVENRFVQNIPRDNEIKKEWEGETLDDKVIEEEYKSATFSEFFTHKADSLPSDTLNVHSTSNRAEKFTQQTINVEPASESRRKDEVQSSNCDLSKDPDFLEDKFYSCKLCNRKFKRKSDLRRHERSTKHINDTEKNVNKIKKIEKKFTCKICGRPSSQLSFLRRHCETHTAIKRYKCDTCDKRFKTKAYLRQHIEAHDSKQYPCKYCSRLYTRKSTLRRHMKLHYADDERMMKPTPKKNQIAKMKLDDDKATAEAALKLYKCDICGQRFKDKSSMEVHIEFLHIELFGEPIDAPQPRTFKPSSDKPFQCRICYKRYTQSSHLKRHEETHLHSLSHICELCGQTFSTTSSLTRHLRVKHDVVRSNRKKALEKVKKSLKDFECKICGRVLTNLGDLRRHCATHDARKPYECDICKKQFAVKGYLYAHILTHDNWKPYPCEICDKVYRRKSSLQRHIQISHSGKKQQTN